jgi:ubiquinone/menaquinone biosynthesis C-methylase UbiE
MLVSALEGHRRWAPHYDSQSNPLLALETRILVPRLLPVTLQCFLDVACGTGRWMAYLRRCGARVFGVDICAEMLARAEQKDSVRGHSVLAEAACLPFETGFADAVLCSFAAGYFADLERAVSEMARAARPGARIVISDLHPAGVSAGWTRSFRLGAEVYEMQHFAPSIEELLAAASLAGLRLDMRVESCFGDEERAYFVAAGKEELHAKVAAVPAIWIGIWTKL